MSISTSRDGKQNGFTLIELMIAMLIGTLLLMVVGWSTYELFQMNTRNTNQMTAVREVQTAGYWVTLNGEMAFSANVTSSSKVVTLQWYDPYYPTEVLNTCVYTLASGKLWRDLNGQSTVIAQDLTASTDPSSPTSFSYDPTTRQLTLRVVARVTSQGITATESRVYQATLRPSPQ